MRTINYKSDFSIIEKFKCKDYKLVPFRFTYYTKSINYPYIAEYKIENSPEFTNCEILSNGDIKVVFQEHNLGAGYLKVKREFFIPDDSFEGGICHHISEEDLDISLEKGVPNDETDKVFDTEIQAYYVTITAEEIDRQLQITATDKVFNDRLNALTENIRNINNNKQDKLESGKSIKTINGESLLGEGNIEIEGSEVDSSKVVTTNTEQSIAGIKKFTNDIYIGGNSNSVIKQNISNGEFKVTHKNSNKGFIVRTNWDNEKDVMPLEALTTNGINNSYSYKFPEKSGTVALIDDVNSKQNTLVSGTNIKTINNQSILGSGNINIQGGGIPEVIDKEIYYNDGSNEVVPVKWPDLSTQPSILPYKFMGQYVYEQLLPMSVVYVSTKNVTIHLNGDGNRLEDLIPNYSDNISILSLNVIAEVDIDGKKSLRMMPILDVVYLRGDVSSYDCSGLVITIPNPSYGCSLTKTGYVKIVYTFLPEGGDYYGYNNY